ncbi:hypothetical protein GEV01_10975 [Rugamonas sp. FT103W]|uniref:Uncharacterized protein n=2 Tax=Rugamonas rivuli TaxID=2743358 RepID=A0A843S753_9BURK|nr:hypothetical protein [Rugamonas rivuli]
MTPRTALFLAALVAAQATAQSPVAVPGISRDVTSAELRDYARLPVCTLSADGKRLAVEPCRTAPARVPMPRRPVPLTIQRMPIVKQAPQVAMPSAPPTPSMQTLLNPPNAPQMLSGCGPTGCYDANGAHINNAGPGTVVSPSGKLCHRNGALMQC